MLQKHSVCIRGHRTSYSLEDEFHLELTRLANQANITLTSLIVHIDAKRNAKTNLSSALRLYVLKNLKHHNLDN